MPNYYRLTCQAQCICWFTVPGGIEQRCGLHYPTRLRPYMRDVDETVGCGVVWYVRIEFTLDPAIA